MESGDGANGGEALVAVGGMLSVCAACVVTNRHLQVVSPDAGAGCEHVQHVQRRGTW